MAAPKYLHGLLFTVSPLALAVAMTVGTPAQAATPAGPACSAGASAADCGAVAPAKLSRKERRLARKQAKQAARDAKRLELNWYPLDKMTIEQRYVTPPHCDGAYIEPGRLLPSFVRETQLEGSRDSGAGRDDESQTMGIGSNTQLRANSASFDQITNEVSATGDIELRESGLLLKSDAAVFNSKTGTGSLYNAEFVFYGSHARGGASEIRRESDTVTRLEEGYYTRCAPGSAAWVLRANEIVIDQEKGEGKARGAQLRLWDVPVFWSPYLAFPLSSQRRSGLLFPVVSTSTSSGGLDFALPVYWNIRPNWDATIAPRYIASRGVAIEGEVRHLNRYSEWTAAGSWIDDREYGDTRWLVSVDEHGNLPKHWEHQLYFTQVSDDDYLKDLSGATSLDLKRSTNLEQSAYMRHFGSIMEFEAAVVRYQVIDSTVNEQYQRLPQLTLKLATDELAFRPAWLLTTQLTQFEINDTDRPAGTRLYLEPGFRLPMQTTWGFLTPTLKARSVFYALDSSHCLQPGIGPGADCTPTEETHPATVTPTVSLDGGLYFNRDTSWFGRRYTHTLEPRLYYLYTRYQDQSDQPLFDTGFITFDYNQLWRESRFTGYDRIDDANQLSVGLSTRLIQEHTGTDTIWASIGQTFHFDDRRVGLDQLDCDPDSDTCQQLVAAFTDPTSLLAGEVGYRWTRNLRSYFTTLYDTNDGDLNQAALQFRYHGDRGLVLNAGQRYRAQTPICVRLDPRDEPDPICRNGGTLVGDNINQTDVSGIIPITRHWIFLGQFNYDFFHHRKLGDVYGVEYNSCCWKARLVYQSGLRNSTTSVGGTSFTEFETEKGLYLQFVLKGLGGADTGVRSVLSDGIVGFDDYDDADRL